MCEVKKDEPSLLHSCFLGGKIHIFLWMKLTKTKWKNPNSPHHVGKTNHHFHFWFRVNAYLMSRTRSSSFWTEIPWQNVDWWRKIGKSLWTRGHHFGERSGHTLKMRMFNIFVKIS